MGLDPTYSGVMEGGVRVMGKPDSPLNTVAPRGIAGERGGVQRVGASASPCGNCQRAEGPAPSEIPQSLGHRNTTGPKPQRVSWEGLRTLGSCGSAG